MLYQMKILQRWVTIMSKYTTEIRFICESITGHNESAGYNSVSSIIKNAAPKIFDFDFPIFDEAYRLPLEIKILRHYYTREISEETVGLWKLRLESRLNEIMPYYNKLYKTELLDFNPFYDVDITRDHIMNNNGESNGSQSGSLKSTKNDESNAQRNSTNESIEKDTNWNLYNDTPQGGIDGIVNGDDNLQDNFYLTNARRITDDNTINGKENINENKRVDTTEETDTSNKTKNTITNTEDYLEHVKGKQGTQSYSSMLMEYRNTFLNIDMQIIENLSDLFFGLW